MQQQLDIQGQIKRELIEGEQLVWSGSPKPGIRSNVTTPGRVFLILGTAFTIIGVIILIVGFIVLSRFTPDSRNDSVTGLFITGGIFTFLGLVYTFLGILMNSFSRFSPRNQLYALTDRRILIIRTGRLLVVDSYGREDIGQIRRIERPDGSGDLIFAVTGASQSYGSNNYNTNNSTWNATLNKQAVFAAISDVRVVEQKLLSLFK